MTKRIAIFAHYDKDHLIDDYVIYYLRELRKVAEIIFVSDCALSPTELKKLDGIVLKSIAKRHGEYDFGSYKRGFQYIEKDLKKYDEMILCNDTCYGPFYPFKDLWQKMDKKECDFWGLFEHWDSLVKKWYVQSYFLVFKKNVFTSPVFKNFMKAIKKEEEKRDIIIKYEVGLSDVLVQQGFKGASLFPKSDQNLTHKKEAFEIIKNGFPFLKRHLLERNVYIVPDVFKHKQALDVFLKGHYPTELIDHHFHRTQGDYNKVYLHYPFFDWKKIVLHKKFIQFNLKNKNNFYWLRIKLGGMTFIKIPLWFNWQFLRYKKGK